MNSKYKEALLLISFTFFTLISFSQSSTGINYQGIAKNSVGEVLVNATISLKFSIIEGNSQGNLVYQETHQITTNQTGLFNLVIGNGRTEIGRIESIKWGDAGHFLKVEMDINGGINFLDMGTTQILYVPYSLYALKSEIADSSNFSMNSIKSDSSKIADFSKRSSIADSVNIEMLSRQIFSVDSAKFSTHSVNSKRSDSSFNSLKSVWSDSSKLSLRSYKSDSSKLSLHSVHSDSSFYSEASFKSLWSDSAKIALFAQEAIQSEKSDSSIFAKFATKTYHSITSDSSNWSDLSKRSIYSDIAVTSVKADTTNFSFFSDSSRISEFSHRSYMSDSSLKSKFADSARVFKVFKDTVRIFESHVTLADKAKFAEVSERSNYYPLDKQIRIEFPMYDSHGGGLAHCSDWGSKGHNTLPDRYSIPYFDIENYSEIKSAKLLFNGYGNGSVDLINLSNSKVITGSKITLDEEFGPWKWYSSPNFLENIPKGILQLGLKLNSQTNPSRATCYEYAILILER